MTNEEAIKLLKDGQLADSEVDAEKFNEAYNMAIEALEQHPCEMTVNEYRNRLMDAFHNADCGELIAVVVRPEESEFKQLEWLLKNHYHNQKQQPCDDCISRQAVKHVIIDSIADLEYESENREMQDIIDKLPSVTPKEKTAAWVPTDEEPHEDYECSACGYVLYTYNTFIEPESEYKYCPNCGARMVSE